MNDNETVRVTVNINKDKWEKFKKLAKYKNSDASKEIRKFVDRYLSENSQLFLKIETDNREKKDQLCN